MDNREPLAGMTKYVTIEHAIRIWVLPEVRRRLADGRLQRADLPLDLRGFQVIMKKRQGTSNELIVQLNDEVQVVLQAKLRPGRRMEKGQDIKLNDIFPEETRRVPPQFDGLQAAYFHCVRFAFDHVIMFDFSPNIDEPEVKGGPVPFPAAEFAFLRDLVESVRPSWLLQELAKRNWPPGPGYFPGLFKAVRQSESLFNADIAPTLRSLHSADYWRQRVESWEGSNLLGPHLSYIKKAIDEHFEGDYASAIYVLVPQFEGIVMSYLREQKIPSTNGFRFAVDGLKNLLLSRDILLFPRDVLELVLGFLRDGSFWSQTGQLADPTAAVNRHGIVHGIFTGFESEELSLKYLVLLDGLAYLLMNDQISSGMSGP